MPLGIIIIGALGRMGKEIAEIVLTDSDFSMRGAVEYERHPLMGKDYGSCIGKDAANIPVTGSIAGIECAGCVCIDFSSPASLLRILPAAAEKKVPVVVGTTGLSKDDIASAHSFSSRIPILISPNMSLGVNILFLLTEMAASRLNKNYDIEIIEAHHRYKKDAPSGTAKRLGEIAAASIGLDYETCVKNGRKGVASSDRSRKEVGMHAVRGGDIVGDHTVLFAGIGERVELRHFAHSRSIFARGSLAAARWLIGQPPGLYAMRDMLGF
ncbi:MAG: 4-hydroxy-tetrahydrodipicolinate reductase [Chitinispirillaceae bacterium]|nr:4-hydroxy-tetrahydrodipicolinate reductase [Chitinispirillaceae bacterium]